MNSTDWDCTSEFLKKNGHTFSTLVDERKEVARNYRVSGIPQVFVIGRDGRVVTHYVGAHGEGDLRAALKKAGVGAQTAAAMQITDSSSPGSRTAAQPQPCVPILLSPRSGDALDNGLIGKSKKHIWEFAWTECPGAAEYHLYVIGSRAIYPVIDDDNIRINSCRRTSDDGYVADANLRGWKWKVRAKINGEWGEWSKTGTFNVKPVGSDSGSDGEPSGHAELYAPRPVAPPNGTVFDRFVETPRRACRARRDNRRDFDRSHTRSDLFDVLHRKIDAESPPSKPTVTAVTSFERQPGKSNGSEFSDGFRSY